MSLDKDIIEKVKATSYVSESLSERTEEGLRLFLQKYSEVNVAPGSDKDLELNPGKKELQKSFTAVKDIMKEVWSERRIKTEDIDG